MRGLFEFVHKDCSDISDEDFKGSSKKFGSVICARRGVKVS